MPSNRLVLCHPLLLLPSIFPSIRVFSGSFQNSRFSFLITYGDEEKNASNCIFPVGHGTNPGHLLSELLLEFWCPPGPFLQSSPQLCPAVLYIFSRDHFVPPTPFPGGASGKESACQCRRHKRYGFDPWVGKIPWRRAWQPTLVFLPGEPHGQKCLVGYSPWGRRVGHG